MTIRTFIHLTTLLAVAALTLILNLNVCGPRKQTRATADTDSALVAAAPDTPALETFVYDCRDRRFIVQLLADTAWLYVADTVIVLHRSPAASGTKYVDSTFMYWSTGQEALFETPRGRYERCRHNKREASWQAARLQGVDYRGLGQEPGWLVEVFVGDSIVFLADYGTRRFVGPAPEPKVTAGGRERRYTTRADSHRLEVVFVEDSCTDIMSGFRFPLTVTVILDTTRYEGCGRAM
jgi:putative lipoprotein